MKKGGNPQNLKPFAKGVDERRNLDGRPPKLPALDKLLDEVLGEEKDGIEAAKAILMALRAKATKGDVRAAEILLDRAYGKSKQWTDITTNGENLNQVKIQIIREPINSGETENPPQSAE